NSSFSYKTLKQVRCNLIEGKNGFLLGQSPYVSGKMFTHTFANITFPQGVFNDDGQVIDISRRGGKNNLFFLESETQPKEHNEHNLVHDGLVDYEHALFSL